MSASQRAATGATNYNHLNKKVRRIELVAAANDHNYNMRPGTIKAPAEEAGPAVSVARGAPEDGHMDDCMAAMVLMFLSCRPGEQPAELANVASCNSNHSAASQATAAATTTTATTTTTIATSGAKRNSEPIEMDTSSQQKSHHRHFKRRPSGAELDQDSQLAVANGNTGEAAASRQRAVKGAKQRMEDDEEDEEEDEDDDDQVRLAFVEAPKVEDDMIFELQVEDPAPLQQQQQQQAPIKQQTTPISCDGNKPDNQTKEAPKLEAASTPGELDRVKKPNSKNNDTTKVTGATKSPSSSSSPSIDYLNGRLQDQHKQLRFRINNPVKVS